MEEFFLFIVDASSTQLYMLGWRNSPANFVEEVGLIHESTYNMDAFVATASCCFLQRSGLYIAVIVEVILRLIIDASSTQ